LDGCSAITNIDHTLKDVIGLGARKNCWPPEIIANMLKGYGHFFMMSRGRRVMTNRAALSAAL